MNSKSDMNYMIDIKLLFCVCVMNHDANDVYAKQR
jgi:hypothetical protein